MGKEFNAYQTLQKLQETICRQIKEDWIEIRNDEKKEDMFYFYFIEDAVMQGCENSADLNFKFHVEDVTGDEGYMIPCYERFHFHSFNENIEITEFYRQYKNNMEYYNKRYSNRFKLSIMTLASFKKLFPELCSTSQNKILLLV